MCRVAVTCALTCINVKVTPGSRAPTRVADLVPSGFSCSQTMSPAATANAQLITA